MSHSVEDLIDKAKVLIEALPYIRNFYGRTFVIKYGGAAQVERALRDSFAQDIVLLNYIGVHPVIVHGGGPRVSEMMTRLGKKPSFVHGHRVTDVETMDIAEMVLAGLVNKEIVSLINSHGAKAVGLSGKDGGLLKAEKKFLRTGATEGSPEGDVIDIGQVGQVSGVDPKVLQNLQHGGFVPVISPIGVGQRGESFNINADFVASALAGALGAEKLVLITDVPGVKGPDGEVISSIDRERVSKMTEQGDISGGMIPKVTAALEALAQGVGKAHIIDGRMPHCLLLEIFTEAGIGTEIVSSDP